MRHFGFKWGKGDTIRFPVHLSSLFRVSTTEWYISFAEVSRNEYGTHCLFSTALPLWLFVSPDWFFPLGPCLA